MGLAAGLGGAKGQLRDLPPGCAMQLHHRHQHGMGCTPMPVCFECSAAATRPQRLRALARLAAQAAAEREAEHRGGPLLHAALSPDCLVVEGNGCRTVHVPVLLSEVGHATVGQGLQCSVVALAPACAPSADVDQRTAWLLVVKGGEDAVRRQLRAFSERGAVRGDLCEEFLVAAKPFSTGVSASVHEARAVRALHQEGPNDGRFAAKAITLQRETEKVDAEVALLLLAQGHPNIVRFCGVWEQGEHEEEQGTHANPFRQPCRVVLTDLCPQGDLHDFVGHRGAYTEVEALQLTSDLLAALAYIHSRGVVHQLDDHNRAA